MPHNWTYPDRTTAERVADGVVHLLALALAIAGTVVLVVLAARHGGGQVVAAGVYGGALVFGFAASAIYHHTPWEWLRPVLRRVDHAAIYLVIAATCTPVVAMIGGAFAWSVLALIWVLALAGALRKLAFWRNPTRADAFLYLSLGWLPSLLMWSIIQVLAPLATALIIAGGVLMSSGVAIFNRDGMRFGTAIWHGFVLAGSACFFAAISLVFAAPPL